MSELTPSELVCTAAALAGPAASDEQVVAEFARAELLLLCAANWLHDPQRRDDETRAYVLRRAESADGANPVLPWNHPTLHTVSGYDTNHPKQTPDERGRLLWDCFDKAIGRTFGIGAVATLREKYRPGISEKQFRELWPLVNKHRRKQAGQLGLSPQSDRDS